MRIRNVVFLRGSVGSRPRALPRAALLDSDGDGLVDASEASRRSERPPALYNA